MGKRKRKRGAAVADTKDIASNLSVTESCGDQITVVECPTQRPSVVGRARRKSTKEVDEEESNDSEQTSPRTFRCRGQTKRRLNGNGTVVQKQEKLDSNTLELYFENLWKSFPEEKRSSFAYLDSLWYSLYTNNSNKDKVLNWIKRKMIFSKKYVFVPIIQWSHWSLLIFCNFGEDINSKTETPCMLLLDSLQLAEPKRLEPGIRKFVLDIYKAEERPEDKKLISKIPLLIPKVPQQRNGEECGNYVLYYMNLFMERAPENFSLLEGYPYFMKEEWFSTEDMESFRKRLELYRE